MEECVFCKIVNKDIPAHIAMENDSIVAFTDKHPINPGHLLVIPKKHKEVLFDLEDQDYTSVMLAVKQLSSSVQKVFQPKKVGLIVAGWDVPHAHIHVVPMQDYHDITSKSLLEGKRSSPTEDELEESAQKLREELR